MTEAEKADALLRLMDMHSARFRQSRDLELKVNLAIWTALVVIGKFLSDARVKVDDWGTLFIYLFVSAVIVICHYRFWLKPVQASEECDSAFLSDSRKEIQALTGTSIKYPNLDQSWICFESGFTAFILAGLAVMLID
jgi:hypothetical protein